MKRTILFLALSLNVMPLLADDSMMQSTNLSSNERELASYAMGMWYGRFLQQRGIDDAIVDRGALMRGLNDSLSGGPTQLTLQEMSQTLRDYQKTIAANQAQMQARAATTNLAIGAAFLATNKDAVGVAELPDGLQYKILKDGSGPVPAPTNRVTVIYECDLLDGTVIESSVRAGRPAQIPINAPGVIAGLKEVLTHMKVGSLWDVWMPADLGYGRRGFRDVPPGASLKFHIVLLGIAPPLQMPPPPAPLTSDIIAVPSAADIAKGKKPYTLTPDQVQQMQMEAQTNQAQSNGTK